MYGQMACSIKSGLQGADGLTITRVSFASGLGSKWWAVEELWAAVYVGSF